MDKEVLLEFENVSYSYDDNESDNDKRFAVKNISFKINKGEFVAILGSNGSGKSTVAKLSNSIYLPNSGKVYVAGMDTSIPENEFAARKKIGVVFQNPDNQIVASIVEEDVAFGPENLGIEPKDIRKRVDKALRDTGMSEYAMHETHRLSGGQKQRVAIAGILAMEPECIVLDEPTAMLDPKGRKDIIKILTQLNKEQGVTVVLITHFMDEAALTDRIIIVNNSEIAADGTPKEIFSNISLLDKCKLELPESVLLREKMKTYGINLSNDIITPDDFVEEFIKFSERSK